MATYILSECLYDTPWLTKHYTHLDQLTPNILLHVRPMSDLAAEPLSTGGCEGHALGQMEVPVRFEGQVSLVGIREFLSFLHQLNSDVRGVEATHMANQDVFNPKLSWAGGVHLNLGWR